LEGAAATDCRTGDATRFDQGSNSRCVGVLGCANRYLAQVTQEPPNSTGTHEWVSFEHDDQTWMFDVTFLTSNWACIWNEGCLGIRSEADPDGSEGCCSFGAHFSDDADRSQVLAAAEKLTPSQWQHHGVAADAIQQDEDGAWTTTIVDDACVFLNRPGFPGGFGCSLHRAALEGHESIVKWKPEVCWQLPLRLERQEDENGHSVATLRQWSRNDWGTGGDDFHWWCTEDSLAFVEHTPVYQRLQDEIRGLVGESLTAQITEYLDLRGAETFLPHPATWRRP